MTMLKPSAEYNQRAAIIEDLRARHSVTEIIRFFGYPRSIVYDVVTKYKALETVQRRFQHASEEESSKERTARTLAVIERVKSWFRTQATIVAKISIDCWYERANNASNYRGGPSIQIVHIKDRTLWGCQDKSSCSLQSTIMFFEKRSIGTN